MIRFCPQGINCVNTADSAYSGGERYTVHAPPNTCQDTDECSTANNCEQNCTNTIGSYECSCMPGYTLEPDLISCIKSEVCQLTAQAAIAVLSVFTYSSNVIGILLTHSHR